MRTVVLILLLGLAFTLMADDVVSTKTRLHPTQETAAVTRFPVVAADQSRPHPFNGPESLIRRFGPVTTLDHVQGCYNCPWTCEWAAQLINFACDKLGDCRDCVRHSGVNCAYCDCDPFKCVTVAQ